LKQNLEAVFVDSHISSDNIESLLNSIQKINKTLTDDMNGYNSHNNHS
jgi:hypothetical protein